jgi:hypothetical protein
LSGIAQDSPGAACPFFRDGKQPALDLIIGSPFDSKPAPRLCYDKGPLLAIPCQAKRQSVLWIEHPSVTCIRREKHQRAKRHDVDLMIFGAANDLVRLACDADLFTLQHLPGLLPPFDFHR